MRTLASGASGRLCILQSVCRVKSLAGQGILSTPAPGFAQFARSQCLQLERQDPVGTLHRVKPALWQVLWLWSRSLCGRIFPDTQGLQLGRQCSPNFPPVTGPLLSRPCSNSQDAPIMQLMGMMLHRITEPWGPPAPQRDDWECLKRFERGVLWDLKNQYGVLVDETASVRRILGQLCCLHRATARLQWKAAKGCGCWTRFRVRQHGLLLLARLNVVSDLWRCWCKLWDFLVRTSSASSLLYCALIYSFHVARLFLAFSPSAQLQLQAGLNVLRRGAVVCWDIDFGQRAAKLLNGAIYQSTLTHALHQDICATCGCSSENGCVGMLFPAGMWYLLASVWQL